MWFLFEKNVFPEREIDIFVNFDNVTQFWFKNHIGVGEEKICLRYVDIGDEVVEMKISGSEKHAIFNMVAGVWRYRCKLSESE